MCVYIYIYRYICIHRRPHYTFSKEPKRVQQLLSAKKKELFKDFVVIAWICPRLGLGGSPWSL